MILLIMNAFSGAWILRCDAQPSVDTTLASVAVESRPIQYVLLKKTEAVLKGYSQVVGQFYEIEIGDQSKVSVPKDQVAFVGDSLESVYEFKKRKVTQWITGDHLQMSRWCLQQGMLPQAIDHYSKISPQDAKHRVVQSHGAELERKVLADEEFRRYLGLAPLAEANENSRRSNSQHPPAEASKSTIVQTVSTSSNPTAWHPEITRRFHERIQPILLNRCSQAACHGVSSNNALRLIEPFGKTASKHNVENMRQVLDNLRPTEDQSPALLKYATMPHGLQREPAINAAETQILSELRAWIRFVESPVVTAGGSSLTANNTSRLTQVPPGSAQLQVVPQASGQQNGWTTDAPPPSESEIDRLEAELNRILAEDPSRKSSSVSGDPFDPAEFNRQAKQRK